MTLQNSVLTQEYSKPFRGVQKSVLIILHLFLFQNELMNINTKLETEQQQYADSIKDLQSKQTQGKGKYYCCWNIYTSDIFIL